MKTFNSLAGRVAIVTGASRGIGFAIASAFADAGAKLLLVALHDDNLESATKELSSRGREIQAFCGDVAMPATAEEAAKAALEFGGGLDILVNCAGIVSRDSLEKTSDESWERVMAVNLTGAFRFCRAALPHMREKNYGRIINITSQMAFMPHPFASPSYEVSKSGLTALTRHIALHYAKFGICSNSIAPGSINTDLPKSMTPEARERLKAGIPMLRLGETSEVAELAVFLASEASGYITGQTIGITGGSLMR